MSGRLSMLPLLSRPLLSASDPSWASQLPDLNQNVEISVCTATALVFVLHEELTEVLIVLSSVKNDSYHGKRDYTSL